MPEPSDRPDRARRPGLGPLARWLDRYRPPESWVLAAAAIFLGAGAALGVWVFKRLIALWQELFFGRGSVLLGFLVPWHVVLLPAVGGVAVALIVSHLVRAERHHGVAGVIEATALAGGRLRYWRSPWKVLAASLAIGSGASVGPEDPSVQVGANLGSALGQGLRFSDERTRALVAAGAAAGVAAAFNAPFAGLFFALEIVLGEFAGAAFGTIALASISSAAVTQALMGLHPAFPVPDYPDYSAAELPLFALLGLLAGGVAAAYIGALDGLSERIRQLGRPKWQTAAGAGLLLGLAGVWFPEIFGVGYETIEKVLTGGGMSSPHLAALLALKLFFTALCLAAGFMGGLFAPALFLGAVLGGLFGQLLALLLPGFSLGLFALVGMAAVLAGAVHAPITAILLLFELTGDYHVLLPALLAVLASILVSRRLAGESVYTRTLARRGVRLERGRDIDLLNHLPVGEVMDTEPVVLDAGESLDSASERLWRARLHGAPVVTAGGRLAGVLSVHDLQSAGQAGLPGSTPVGEVATREPLTAFPDDSLADALRQMGARDVARLPVVARDDPGRLVGVLYRTDVARVYTLALARRTALRQRASEVQLDALSGVATEAVVIAPGAAAAGRTIAEVPWPREAVVASVRRGERLLLPRGDTRLEPGDELSAVVDGEAARLAVRRLCREPLSPDPER